MKKVGWMLIAGLVILVGCGSAPELAFLTRLSDQAVLSGGFNGVILIVMTLLLVYVFRSQNRVHRETLEIVRQNTAALSGLVALLPRTCPLVFEELKKKNRKGPSDGKSES